MQPPDPQPSDLENPSSDPQLPEPFATFPTAVYAVAFSPDGRRVAVGLKGGTIELWDLVLGEKRATFEGHGDIVYSVAFSPDGKTIVSGSRDKTIRLWDLQGKAIGEPFQGHGASVWSVAFSPDGKTIVSGSDDQTIRRWDLQGKAIGEPFQGHGASVWSVAFSPDGKTIVSGSDDQTIRLWDLQGKAIGEPFQGHGASVWSVAFSPDGKTIVSGSRDQTIRLWDFTDPQQKRNLLIGIHPGEVYSVAFDLTGDYIFSAGENGIRAWRWPKFEVQRIPQAFQNDQPGDEDKLAIEKELRALADVLMMRSLEPPLAVAILGGWGSGKSFGMNLIKKHITAIRCRSLTPEQTWSHKADDPKLSPYVGHIYQIKFDAWTYAKSDIWASLMQTIFSELDRQLMLEKQLARLGSIEKRQDLKKKLEEELQALKNKIEENPQASEEPTEASVGLSPNVGSPDSHKVLLAQLRPNCYSIAKLGTLLQGLLSKSPESQPKSNNEVSIDDSPKQTLESLVSSSKLEFSSPLLESELNQFEKILAACELNPEEEISKEKQDDPETDKYWKFLAQLGETAREDLTALAQAIKTDESNFLLEKQEQDFWQALHTLSDAERDTLLNRAANSKLPKEEIKKWKENGGEGNFLWEILDELKQEEQKKLKDTKQELKKLKLERSLLKKDLDQFNQGRDQYNENLAIVIALLEQLKQGSKDNSIFEDWLKALGPEIPQDRKQLIDDLDSLVESTKLSPEQLRVSPEQVRALNKYANKVKSLLENEPSRKLIGLFDFIKANQKVLLTFVLLLSLPFFAYAIFGLFACNISNI
ncbi:hypothetical protein C8255_21385 [filamentous cyanobacterium CCP3]|nr:hypothetical protein C8255_21385 [filamentous cyanobacterium CCP3]